MPATPHFSYFVSPSALSALGARGEWLVPLPLNRFGASGTPGPPLRRMDYFTAARRFLRQNQYARLLGALSRRVGREVRPEALREIQIHLAKHGEFYHPARVAVHLPGQAVSLVLNVAVSAAGRSILHREYALLERLGDDRRYLPQVYAVGEVPLPKGAGVLGMFLGEWFDAFCEFHPSRDPSTGRKRVRVWGANTAAEFLTPGQTHAVFRQAAEILTHFYDVQTFAQIHPWHHAAGDFVLRRRGRSLDVKLVTVRNYAPLVVMETQSREALLTALLLFLLNLTLRMRLDRRDGVGELVWADRRAVSASVDGFWAALSAKPCLPLLGEPTGLAFQRYCDALEADALMGLAGELVAACHPQAPELPLLRRYLRRHVAQLHRVLTAGRRHPPSGGLPPQHGGYSPPP